jgi:hypothetical protein
LKIAQQFIAGSEVEKNVRSSRRDDGNHTLKPTFVHPSGTPKILIDRLPSSELLGYSNASLRDE